MPPVKMHVDEVPTDGALVRRLLRSQFPEWASLPISALPSSGTDNAIYRLGSEMSVRLPRIGWATGQADKEREWLPKLARYLPLRIPSQIALGQPDEGYPWSWSVCKWIDGEAASMEALADPCECARTLGLFIRALRGIDTQGGPLADEHGLRGTSLFTRDASTREAITKLDGAIDTRLATKVWDAALKTPEWHHDALWFHGDLLPGNILIEHGHPVAIIDFGGLGVGDPACDLMIAWALFTSESRKAFRAVLQVDDATWMRGMGHALSQAVIFVPYYLQTNPLGVDRALRQISAVLADFATLQ